MSVALHEVRCKYTSSVCITRYKKPVTHVEPDASAVSLLKRAENRAISAITNQSKHTHTHTHTHERTEEKSRGMSEGRGEEGTKRNKLENVAIYTRP